MPNFLSAFRIQSYRFQWGSDLLNSWAFEMETLILGWFVLVTTDSPLLLAAFAALNFSGTLLSPFFGVLADRVDRVRLLYLYPSDLTDGFVDAVLATGLPYFDLSLQHVSRQLLANMRRWGDGRRFRERIDHIRNLDATATFRSNFIVGYPGETEEDHDELLAFVKDVGLDWCGFFAFSDEAGTHAAGLPDRVAEGLVAERLRELGELQDTITAARRDALIGSEVVVLVDEPGVGRTHREAPEIDGVVHVSDEFPVGEFATVTVTGALGPDLVAT